MMNLVKSCLVPINKEGYIFIGIGLVVAFIFMSFSDTLGWLAFLATLFIVFFFRDPYRVTPMRDGLVVAPADGIVENIEEVSVPSEFMDIIDDQMMRVSIFLNVFDVHVNRIPIEGKIIKHHYNQGKFLSANLDKASDENERNSFVVETKDNEKVIFVQIAGLIARRIVWYIHEGDDVEKGQKFGMIRFGSRMDVYLPKNLTPLVVKGQRMIGGETVIADFAAEDVEPLIGNIH